MGENSSQTAPIDEYRVLWTTQKKQKLKKWHDGFLRFHKFNRRMLVYDDARHLVADMYLRGRDAIGEGDNLEFEHHLVTIEDFKGTVVQDLTTLFSPAVQRKQQIRAGNALLNSPTPNRANCHGPWGPSRYGTPTPQSIQQQQPVPAAGPPQTPVQQRPISVPGLTFQQAARQGIDYPTPAQNIFSRSAQQLPPSVSRNVASRASPPRQGPLISHPPPRLRPNPVPPAEPDKPLPFYAPSGQLGSERQPNPLSPSAPLQRPQAHPPQPNHAPPRHSRPRPDQRPSVTPNPDADLGPNRPPPGIQHPVPPQKPPPPAQSNHALSHPVPSRPNKHAPGVTPDTGNDPEQSKPPLISLSASPRPVPLSRQNSVAVSSRENKRPSAALNSNSETRPFKPPIKRKSNGTPAALQPRLPKEATNKIDDIISDGENSPPFKPLVSPGVLRLNNTTSRKRSKLLCQRPMSIQAAARNTIPSTKENDAKNLGTGLASRIPSPPEDVMVIGDGGGPGDKPAALEALAVSRRKSSNTSRSFKVAGKHTESRENDKGKGQANGPNLNQGYRIEKEDTLQYQQDNDIGPWSSEAFDLFDWRPPGIEGRK